MAFDTAIEQCLSKPMSVKDLNDIGIDTPEYELYANDDQGAEIHTPDIDDMTLKILMHT